MLIYCLLSFSANLTLPCWLSTLCVIHLLYRQVPTGVAGCPGFTDGACIVIIINAGVVITDDVVVQAGSEFPFEALWLQCGQGRRKGQCGCPDADVPCEVCHGIVCTDDRRKLCDGLRLRLL